MTTQPEEPPCEYCGESDPCKSNCFRILRLEKSMANLRKALEVAKARLSDKDKILFDAGILPECGPLGRLNASINKLSPKVN